jgi:hypothetical protein
MNIAEFNMLLLLGFGVAALIGKAIYEKAMTRSEERRSLAASSQGADSRKRGAKLAPHS